jgi:hypothetical protein
MTIVPPFETRLTVPRETVVSRRMLSPEKYAALHKIGGSWVEEQRVGQTHPDVLALNSQLEAALERLAGVVAFSGRSHSPFLHAVCF